MNRSEDGLSQLIKLFFGGRWNEVFFAPTCNGWIQLFRYCFVGGLAFFADYGVYCLLGALGVHYMVAGVIAFVIAFVFNFLVSRWMIFKASASEKPAAGELLSVLAVSLIGLALTEALLYLQTELLLIDYRVSKIIASLIVLIWNYMGRKLFVYKNVKK